LPTDFTESQIANGLTNPDCHDFLRRMVAFLSVNRAGSCE
jgi:hypothetical protein